MLEWTVKHPLMDYVTPVGDTSCMSPTSSAWLSCQKVFHVESSMQTGSDAWRLMVCRLLMASRIARLCGVAYMLALHAFLALLVYAAIDGPAAWIPLEASTAQTGTQPA